MIDQRSLDYDFDEERLGFEEPAKAEGPADTRTSLQTVGLALVGIGLISMLVQVFHGAWNGTWPGFLSSFGLLAFGAAVTFWGEFKDTTPGIKHDGNTFSSMTARGALGWLAGIAMTGIYIALYFYPEYLGYAAADSTVTGGLVLTVQPVADALGVANSQWFLYGILYTLAILVFGVRMFMKYRHNRYEKIRTASVMLFQTLFAWYLPQLLVYFHKPYVEFNGVWPLKQDYLWPDKVDQFGGAGAIGWFLLAFVIGGVIATPILTYYFGKRWYCSWVCGCGGLAETLGDPWRQLSDKSTSAWKIERWMIHSVLVFVLITTVFLWVDWPYRHELKHWYGFLIGATFSGVVGVGFYPLLGSRVWCRFGCPQAAILGLFQRYFSRFRITTNGGQCMSCGNCSTYCEMGIDVRAYAQQGKNIVRASCVGCGVCSAVCPRGVLKLENGATSDERYDGADTPVSQFLADLRGEPKA